MPTQNIKKELLDDVLNALDCDNSSKNQAMIPQLEDIVIHSDSAEDAMCRMYEHCDNIPHKVWLLYVKAKGILINKFPEKDSMYAINIFASHDQYSDISAIRNSAKRFLHRYDRWRNIPNFLKEMEDTGVAGFRSGGLLYVVHPCVKPDSRKLQCTVFGESIGPISDTQHNSVQDFVESGLSHVGIPPYAEFLTFDELTKVEKQFQEAINTNNNCLRRTI